MVRRDGATRELALSLPARLVLPRFAALRIRRISLTAIRIGVYTDLRERSQDTEVVSVRATELGLK